MRLHTDAVDRAGGVITSNGELVTGVVYATSGTPDILTIENVLAGRVVGEAEADSPWRVVCVTEEDADREYAIGDLEHGIQYVFDPDGRLAEEEEFSHGELVEARTWFDSGAIASRTCYSTSGVNSECWHESGQLAGIERLGVSVRYHKDGGVGSLRLHREFDKAYLKSVSLVLSDFVSLAGEGLTNDVLAMFTGWERVVHLAIRDTSLTPDALELIGRCPLTRLTTGNNRNISRNAMEQVAANNDSLLWVDSDAYQ